MAQSAPIKTLLTRSISAIIAIFLCFLLFYLIHTNILRVLTTLAVFLGGRELTRILFGPEDPLFLKGTFFCLLVAIYSLSSLMPETSGLSFSLISILFCSFSIAEASSNYRIENLAQLQGRSLLGFFYLGLLPSFVFRLYYLENGLVWFLFLLLVVFAGDTFAYLTGMKFGKHKILPSISPKKTIEGSLGGLCGSIITALSFHSILAARAPMWSFVLMGLTVGVVAQFGDFFESLLKRIANRKDSGSIMPGHGGILDRIDGILFAAPVVFAFAQFFTAN